MTLLPQVARIQIQVYHALARMNASRQSRNINDALAQLNSRLMDVTTVCTTPPSSPHLAKNPSLYFPIPIFSVF